jgi:hypothetical protein
MPLTFPSHAAAVVPIKVAWPDRWDGVALVIGSTAPDLPYALAPYVEFDAHTWPTLVWFCVPITLLGAWLVRRAAPTIAAHLPKLGGFALRDYGSLGAVRHRWYVTVYSAFVGVLTHLVWDSFTHERATHIWTFLPLDRIAFAGLPWWHVLQFGSTVVGALVTAVYAWHIGRRHLLLTWHGSPPLISTRPYRFWLVAVVVSGLGLDVIPALAASKLSFVLGVRLLIIGAVSLLAAALVTSAPPTMSRKVRLRKTGDVRDGGSLLLTPEQ